MKTIREEMDAAREVMSRAEVHTADCDAELERLGVTLKNIASLVRAPLPPGEDALMVGVLYRGRLLLPDNLVAACADCAEPIQHRPKLPPEVTAKLCAPCMLRRVRGDA